MVKSTRKSVNRTFHVTCHDREYSTAFQQCHASNRSLTSTMVKSTWKTRLQTYRAKDLGSLERKGVLLSNTSSRLRKVVTSVPILASHSQKSDGDNGQPEFPMVDESMDLPADINTNATSCADFEHPVALRIRTRAKQYQNSVSWSIHILLLLDLKINTPRTPPSSHGESIEISKVGLRCNVGHHMIQL
jgi:hypothetical protein